MVRKTFKWTMRIVGGLLGLVVLALGVVYAWSEVRINRTFEVEPEKVEILTDAASLERGRHLVVNVGKCGECHGENFGGRIMVDDPVLGRLAPPNITKGKGGRVAGYTDEDWIRTVRYGVRPDGTALLFMPSHEYWHYDDEELGAMIGYLKTLPPVDREGPENAAGPMIRLLYLAGQVDLMPTELIDHDAPRPPAPVPGPTAEYGKHMIMTAGCVGCHGPTLSGGKIPGAPPDWLPSRNITPDQKTGIGSWAEEDFFRALRQGRRPDGTELNPNYMPWKYTAKMTDDEIRALWLYLRTVPAKEAGNR